MDSFCYFTNQIPGGKSATGQHTRCYLFELFEKKHDNSTVRECLGVCVCVLGRERSWVFAGTALTVAWMSMYQTGNSDCLVAFHEPLLPLYRCHTGLKNVQCND